MIACFTKTLDADVYSVLKTNSTDCGEPLTLQENIYCDKFFGLKPAT